MKEFISKHKTKIMLGIICILLGIIGVSAAYIFSSSEVSYDNSKSKMSSTNVQDAIDELYGVARLTERMDELEETLTKKVDDYWKTVYPVGSIYISIKNTNPSSTFGGTWVAYGSGRTLVGVNTSDSSFSTVEKTGGEKTHTLTVAEMPKHSHVYYLDATGHTSWDNTHTITVGLNGITGDSYKWLPSGTLTLFQNTEYTGGSSAHNNLQPYITVYMWKRTA